MTATMQAEMKQLRVQNGCHVWIKPNKIQTVVHRNDKRNLSLARDLYNEWECSHPGYPVSLNRFSKYTGWYQICVGLQNLWVKDDEVFRV